MSDSKEENEFQEQEIKSKFAKKLDNGQYQCVLCKVKLPEYVKAVKHFYTSEEHKKKVEEFKERLKNQLTKQSQANQQQSQIQQQQLGYKIYEESEVIEENDMENNTENQEEEKQNDMQEDFEKFANEIKQISDNKQQDNQLEEIQEYKENQQYDIQQDNQEDQNRIHGLMERILQKKQQSRQEDRANKKRTKKINIGELLKDSDVDIPLKRKKKD